MDDRFENLHLLFHQIRQYHTDFFINFFHNKNVAIVAPGKALLSQNMGFEIDSYDVVVKINFGYRLPPLDYGTRVDVLYFNKKIQLEHHWSNQLDDQGHLIKCNHSKILSFLDSLKLQHSDLQLIQLNSQSPINQPLSSTKYTYNIQYSFMPIIEHFFQQYLHSQTHPLLGTQAIIEILACQPHSLKLFGFDFYNKVKVSPTLTYADLYPPQYYNSQKLNLHIDISHKDTLNIDISIITKVILEFAHHRNTNSNKYNTSILYTHAIKQILLNFIRLQQEV